MMKLGFVTLTAILLFSACKESSTDAQKAERVDKVAEAIKEGYMEITDSSITSDQIKKWRIQAESELANRQKKDNNKAWATLDVGVWEKEFVFGSEGMSKEGAYAGHWVDYAENLTYERGIYDEVKEKGRYHYSPDTGVLLMVPASESLKPEEYEIKVVNNTMIWMGTISYRDNGSQTKLTKLEARPKRS